MVWLRNQNYIPYDQDIDIHICYTDIKKLFKLTKYHWCHYADKLRPNMFKKGEIRLILNRSHNEKFGNRIRYNCDGKRVDRLVDDCSFNGPIGRLIYRPLSKLKKRYLHIDIYLYHQENNAKKERNLL